MSITHHSLPSTVSEQISHTNVLEDAKIYQDHPLYHHHDPYNNAIVIDDATLAF
jgi:hypothetical protein